MSTTSSASGPNVIFNESPSAEATIKALEHEAAAARAAMADAFTGLKHELQTAADPREWAQRRPWVALGVAAAAGFVAASVFSRPRGRAATNGHMYQAAAAPPSGPSWKGLMFDLARVFLTTQLLPLVQTWMQNAGNQADGDETDAPQHADASSAAVQGEMAS